MNYHKRNITENIINDLKKKMVFIGGPRQVGKTVLAKEIISKYYKSYSYYNWDYSEDRKDIINYRFGSDSELIIFDEIHKYRDWKNYLKGIYDKFGEKYSILVTGSSRLNIYRRGGDSLFGRYYYYRLHPFTLSEYLDIERKNFKPFEKLVFEDIDDNSPLDELLKFGGFPEPLFGSDEIVLNRWHNMRKDRIIKEDIRDVRIIKDLSGLQILVDNLEKKVSSLFSIKSIAEDISVSFKTVQNWVNILEEFYYVFRVYPFTKTRVKSLKKMPKIYLYDWSEVKDVGARFENMVALHLLKFVNYLYDVFGYRTNLYYLRDMEGREVDFLVTIDDKPWFSVEVKNSSKSISKNLYYFVKRENIPFNYQVVYDSGVDYTKDNIRVISAVKFLTGLR